MWPISLARSSRYLHSSGQSCGSWRWGAIRRPSPSPTMVMRRILTRRSSCRRSSPSRSPAVRAKDSTTASGASSWRSRLEPPRRSHVSTCSLWLTPASPPIAPTCAPTSILGPPPPSTTRSAQHYGCGRECRHHPRPAGRVPQSARRALDPREFSLRVKYRGPAGAARGERQLQHQRPGALARRQHSHARPGVCAQRQHDREPRAGASGS